jgi:N-acetylmuramoyl-L-alanine amidase
MGMSSGSAAQGTDRGAPERPVRRRGRGAAGAVRGAVLALAFSRVLPAAEEPEFVKTVAVSQELKVSIARGDLVYLFAKPLPGESIAAFAGRFSDDPKTQQKILQLNSRERVGASGSFLRVPYDLLSDNYKKIAMGALFPADAGTPEAWTHVVSAPAGDPESLWRIAEWFTGDGSHYAEIRRRNALASLQTEPGQKIEIPSELLLPAFRSEALAAGTEAPPSLSYGKDDAGKFASYKLRKGEALYSSVVVRFTGLMHAEDVNAEAARVAARSGIADVHAIPVGFAVKIPQEDLLPEYRPPNDPVRVEHDRSLLETSQFANRIRAVDLKEVTVVLDPGHGGRDTGALVEGVAESRYVYDIVMRIADLLRRHTKARVVSTVEDGELEAIPDRDRLAASPGGKVMTTPPYPIEDTVAGVHLRWYLANSLLRAAVKKGTDPSRVIFLSVHADSLHPAVRGAMVYIPGEKLLKNSFGKEGSVYEARREYRQQPRVSFSRRERLQSEGVSRQLAEQIIGSFRRDGLAVHAFNPIRQSVIRSGREWVPAVLRYNAIPARALLEVCNLNNPEDHALIQTRHYRENVARGVVEALSSFYSGPAPKGKKASRTEASVRGK